MVVVEKVQVPERESGDLDLIRTLLEWCRIRRTVMSAYRPQNGFVDCRHAIDAEGIPDRAE